jgi:DNA-binding SARP family transcriptional activator
VPGCLSRSHPTLPALEIACFGRFRVRRGGKPLQLCPSRNGQAILRLLISRAHYSATADEVMEIFWPDDGPATARHKLHIAVSALRGSLNEGLACGKSGYIICDDGMYRLNPAATVRTDVDAFLSAYKAGRAAEEREAEDHFRLACSLYSGPFLAEDRYADWPVVRREQLTQLYLQMCEALAARALADGRPDEAVHWARRVLAENRCDEAAHRLAMSAHAAAGRRAEALRQYQGCAAALREEMGIEPDGPTEELLQQILGSRARA